MTASLGAWARSVKRDAHAIFLAARDRRVPWYAKALAFLVAGYALSPIDLIPDFIPILGYVDNLVIVPLGIWAVVKLIRPEFIAEHRAAAALARHLLATVHVSEAQRGPTAPMPPTPARAALFERDLGLLSASLFRATSRS